MDIITDTYKDITQDLTEQMDALNITEQYNTNNIYDTTDYILADIKLLSTDEKSTLMYDIFCNELDIYASYESCYIQMLKSLDPAEFNLHNHHNQPDQSDQHDNYDDYGNHHLYSDAERLRILGVPNVYCRNYYDDEDFIYKLLGLTEEQQLVIQEQLNNNENIMLNYNVITQDINELYAKIIHTHQFIQEYYGAKLKKLKPKHRVMFLQNDIIDWADNIVCTIWSIVDNCLFQSNVFYNSYITKTIEPGYCNELLYGLRLTTYHIKMILNHHQIRYQILQDTHQQQTNISKFFQLISMEEKHIKYFFRILNNLCIIAMFLRLGC